MLTIRGPQIQALRDGVREQFLSEVMALLPVAAACDEARVRATVSRAIDRARDYGLDNKPEACLFACAALVLGEGFDATPWATAILTSSVAPPVKTKHLFEAIRRHTGAAGV